MSHASGQFDEVQSLLDQYCLDELTAEQAARLEELAAADAAICDRYLRMATMCAGLRCHGAWAEDGRVAIGSENRVPSRPLPGVEGEAGELGLFDTQDANPSAPCLPPPSPHFGFVSNTIGYFSQEIPFALLIATAVIGLGLWIGSLITVSRNVEIARESVPPIVEPSAFGKIEYVGRITGMVDVRWAEDSRFKIQGLRSANHKSEIINHKSFVSLGDRFALASGLMQITYDTGAKVILQGPCTYEVESGSGGFLSLGKLTAKVEKRGERREEREDGAVNPKSQILNPKFVVKTPLATVTDLGTEFGVEVREAGGTSTHVFRGAVEVQPATHDGHLGQPIRLNENESAQVETGSNGKGPIVRRIAADLAGFVRIEQLPKLAEKAKLKQKLKPFERWQAYSQKLRRDPSLLAYYDFQQKEGEPAVLPNVAVNGDHSLDGVVENVTWSDGRLVGKHALLFNNRDDYVSINLPQQSDDLTLIAWINIQAIDKPCNSLLMSSGWGKDGQVHWQLSADGRISCDIFGNGTFVSMPVFDRARFNRWTHVAVVYNHVTGCAIFYIDGQSIGQAIAPRRVPICIGPARIGSWDRAKYLPGGEVVVIRNLLGNIDELAVFGRPLTASEIAQMYENGKP